MHSRQKNRSNSLQTKKSSHEAKILTYLGAIEMDNFRLRVTLY